MVVIISLKRDILNIHILYKQTSNTKILFKCKRNNTLLIMWHAYVNAHVDTHVHAPAQCSDVFPSTTRLTRISVIVFQSRVCLLTPGLCLGVLTKKTISRRLQCI